jgi:hypothetical protein
MKKNKTITITPVNPELIINTLDKIESEFAEIVLDRKDMIKLELIKTLNSIRSKYPEQL